jgi:hypothetical protein
LIDGISKKQKLVTQSSTEAELVSLNTGLNALQWARNLLVEMGFPQECMVVYHDNQSSIALSEGGIPTEKTRHLKMRYFRAKELIDQGEVRLQYLPTLQMDADIQTKPLPPSRFEVLRDGLLNAREGCVTVTPTETEPRNGEG